MASRGRGARAKGANFERSLAKIITESTSIEARRGLAQTRGGGAEVSDVEMPKIHIEAKRQKRCNIRAALEQAINDCQVNGKIPVAVTKDDRKDALVTMRLDDWLPMLDAYLEQDVQEATNKSETTDSES
jgi:hypothetical protein